MEPINNLTLERAIEIFQELGNQPNETFDYLECRLDAYNEDGLKLFGFFKKSVSEILEQIKQFQATNEDVDVTKLHFELTATPKNFVKAGPAGTEYTEAIVDKVKLR